MLIHNTQRIGWQWLRAYYILTRQHFLLYHFQNSVRNYKKAVDTSVLAALENEVKNIDLDEYLLVATMSLYSRLFSSGGYSAEFIYSDVRPKASYLFLCERGADYLTHSGEEIALFNTPSSAEQWISADGNHDMEVHLYHDKIIEIEETDEEHFSKLENSQNNIEENLSQLTVSEEFTQICDQEWASGEDSDNGYDKTNNGYFLDL